MSRKDQLFEIAVSGKNLLDRVVSILNQARSNVVSVVNSNMVIAYWLIGREIVQEIQKGDKRAEYGKQVIDSLSKALTKTVEPTSPLTWISTKSLFILVKMAAVLEFNS